MEHLNDRMIARVLAVWAVWSLRISLVTGLENACLLPVTRPDQLFLGVAGGSAQSLGEVTAVDYEHCIDQCCNGTEGLCNVVVYFKRNLPNGEDLNCLLYQCRPLASCSFNSDDEYEVFADADAVRENTAGASTKRSAETTQPADSGSEISNTTHSLVLPEVVDSSTIAEDGSSENETAITESLFTREPSNDNITRTSAVSSGVYVNGTQAQKYDVTLVPEGNASLTQNMTSSPANGQTSESSTASTARSQITTSAQGGQQQVGGNSTTASSLNTTGQSEAATRQAALEQSLPTTTTATPAAENVDDASQQEDSDVDIDRSSRITSMSVLITALAVGCLFFVAAVALVAKRCHDSWKKRHYTRVEYLVEGMYQE